MQDSQPTQNPLLKQTRGKQEQNRNEEVKGRKRWRLNRHKGGVGKTHTEEATQPTTARETRQTGQGLARGRASIKKTRRVSTKIHSTKAKAPRQENPETSHKVRSQDGPAAGEESRQPARAATEVLSRLLLLGDWSQPQPSNAAKATAQYKRLRSKMQLPGVQGGQEGVPGQAPWLQG